MFARHDAIRRRRLVQNHPAGPGQHTYRLIVDVEVARRAYFAYENERSQPGHDVQHWLKAEADVIAERNLTRTHGFHNQT